VRFTVTALGSAGDRPVGAVVGAIARYLISPDQRTETTGPPGTEAAGNGQESVGRYYADSGDSPGRWMGQGAQELTLAGAVDFDDFTTVLAGRAPRTGERLITARGSAGRVASLGSGSVARWGPDGEALYSIRDVATVLGWTQADVRQAVDEGEHLAATHAIAALTGTTATDVPAKPGDIETPSRRGPGPGRDDDRETGNDAPNLGQRPDASRDEAGKAGPAASASSGRDRDRGTSRPGPGPATGTGRDDTGMALVPHIDQDGTRYVGEAELSRVEALVARGVSSAEVLAGGDADEDLSVPAAARLVGTSRGYLSRLCRSYLEHQPETDTKLADGETPKRAYLVCRRDRDRNYRVTRADLAAYADRRRRPAVRVGYDVTATTEKSISVLALLGGTQVRHEALAAVEAANDTGMRWLERHASAARAGGQVVGVTGWTAASFQHLTSRRLDPFVHHHNVVANTVLDEHGDRRALDARRLYRNVTAASAIATAQVRYELTACLGVTYRPGRRGGWEIAGIADPVLHEFSQRRREINDAIRELEEALGRASTLDELNNVVATTRPAKTAADEADLLADWWDRAKAHGLTPADLHQSLGRAKPTVLTAKLRAKILAAAGDAVTAERSIFTRADLLATLVDLPHPDRPGPLVISAAALERLADEFLGSTRAVALSTTTGRHDRLERADGTTLAVGGDHEIEYTTTDMLAIQSRTFDRYAAGLDSGNGSVDLVLLADALTRNPELSAEQRQLVSAFCTSGDRAQSGIGRPGTGKTHTMRAAVTAWQTAGYRVVGAAVKSEAARHLGDECGIPAEPLAWYLNRLDDHHHAPLDGRTVLIVDEASTIGDRALDQLLRAAEATGATIRMIGDPAQHGAIPAGGMWHALIARHADRTPELTTNHRVEHHDDRTAAEALRHGQVADALAALEAAGHLHIVPSERDLYIALVTRWWTSRQDGHAHPMVDRRNDQRLVLNRLARALRRQAGELGDTEITAKGDRRFAVGDDVVARMGDRHLHPHGQPDSYVRNGTRGTVTAIHAAADIADDRLTVDFNGLGPVEVPRAFFDEHRDPWGRLDVGLDHAYAITSYAVEGLTYDESTSHIDPRSSRPEVYVDITRGRQANHVYVTQAEDDLADERLPASPAASAQRQLEDRLAQSGAQSAAAATDPLLAEAAAYAEGKSLAELTGERLAGDNSAIVRIAERIRARQIAKLAAARSDAELVRRLGPQPQEAHLVDRYEQLLGEVAVYRARWNPRPDAAAPWGWVLGAPIAHPEAEKSRRAIVDVLELHQFHGGRPVQGRLAHVALSDSSRTHPEDRRVADLW
jgi:conjugative relaxase-like TrwC/TraI family protein